VLGEGIDDGLGHVARVGKDFSHTRIIAGGLCSLFGGGRLVS
jgi:hypothetical protein